MQATAALAFETECLPPLALVDPVGPGAPSAGDELSDGDLGRSIVFGLTVGTLLVFLVTIGIALLADVEFGAALGVAGLPALFGGIYFGGAPALLARLRRLEDQERLYAAPAADGSASR